MRLRASEDGLLARVPTPEEYEGPGSSRALLLIERQRFSAGLGPPE